MRCDAGLCTRFNRPNLTQQKENQNPEIDQCEDTHFALVPYNRLPPLRWRCEAYEDDRAHIALARATPAVLESRDEPVNVAGW